MRPDPGLENHRSMASSTIEALNLLLRFVLGARDAYEMAASRVTDGVDREGRVVHGISRDHRALEAAVRREIPRLGGEPEDTLERSIVWAAIAKMASDPSGPGTVAVLKEIEKHGVRVAKAVLAHVEGPTYELVRLTIIPLMVRHLDQLDALAAAP